MKKILFSCLLFVAGFGAYAQTASLMVNNHTDWIISVKAYGFSPSSCSGTFCSTFGNYSTNVIPMSWFTSWGPYTPCAMSTSGLLALSCTPIPLICSSLPADFQWSYADITVMNDHPCSPFSLNVGDAGIGCLPAVSPLYFCNPYNFYATWTPVAGGPLGDVTIDVYYY